MSKFLKAFWAKLNGEIGELWEKEKLFVIIFGVLIVIIKFRDVIIDLLISSSKRVLDNAKKEDDKLAKKEDDAKARADEYRREADEAGSNRPKVDEDWNK